MITQLEQADAESVHVEVLVVTELVRVHLGQMGDLLKQLKRRRMKGSSLIFRPSTTYAFLPKKNVIGGLNKNTKSRHKNVLFTRSALLN